MELTSKLHYFYGVLRNRTWKNLRRISSCNISGAYETNTCHKIRKDQIKYGKSLVLPFDALYKATQTL